MPDRAGTRLFAVAGDPVAHSLSPAMHTAAIQALGLDATYVAARTTRHAFPALVHEILDGGGGLNVTMPFKADAAALLAHPSARVRQTGACNTIWGDPERPSGDNTDVEGMRAVLRGTGAQGHRGTDTAIIQGTGGAARAVAIALGDEYAGIEIAVISRAAERAEAFATWAQGEGVRCKPWRSASAPLFVRAVPADHPMPDGDAFVRVHRAIDLVYAKGETAFVHAMRAQGKSAEDGRSLLVAQGAAAFRHFFGVDAPVDVMREAVEDALRP